MANFDNDKIQEFLKNGAVVLDVRTLDEVEELGIIPEALNIDIFKGQGFIDEIQKLDTSKNYFVYCKAGGRSAQACAIMNQLGFEKTYNLLGGFQSNIKSIKS